MLAVVVAAIGTVLCVFPGDGEVSFGHASKEGEALPAVLFVTFCRVIGIFLLWLGTQFIAGLVGPRLATRRQTDWFHWEFVGLPTVIGDTPGTASFCATSTATASARGLPARYDPVCISERRYDPVFRPARSPLRRARATLARCL